MKAVILAAGEGKRMHPLTYSRPKVMLPLANKPILEHLLLEAREGGIREFIFVVGYHGDTVRNFFGNGDGWQVSIEYVTQRKQLGTTHALRMVERLVDGKFLLINGDVIVGGKDIRRMVAKNETTLSLVEVTSTQDLGVVEVEEGRVVRIHEKVAKPPSNLANAGLYLLTPDIFTAALRGRRSPRGEYEITDSLQVLIDEQHRVSYEVIDYWLDLSYPWDLLGGNEALMSKVVPQNLGQVEENVVTSGLVSVGKGTVVRANSYIVGPVVIGENCEIGPSCYIRPSTSIGDNCHIGSAVEVKNSIIMRDSKIPHHNYVGDSVIGEGCNLGAGTKIANLRLDKKEIKAVGIDTGRHKLGAILGDGVQSGINACIDVGSLIGNDTYIGAGALASGVIAPNSRIFG
ncbi:MAG: NTP transferase domain-containing protein [Dehalococcoidia bacterium]|nr:NTP transferase domain-containing protein [Dehalococcoidia bacterium]